MSILAGKRIYVTGAGGFLGKTLCPMLTDKGATVITNRYDLTDHVPRYSLPEGVDLVIHLAADVRGISLNSRKPLRFLLSNTLMAMRVVEMCIDAGNVPLVAAGSVCAYPAEAPLPFNENNLWDGRAEKSNYGYGLAKRFLSGLLECAGQEHDLRYASLISANLYGPGDHFEDEHGHVIPALIKKIHQAKLVNAGRVEIWGTGRASRDFLYVDDAARAYGCAAEYLLEGKPSLECNIGSGQEHRIAGIAMLIARILDYQGDFYFDTSKPDGQMRRLLDVNKSDMLLDWFNTTSIRDGLAQTIKWYLENIASE